MLITVLHTLHCRTHDGFVPVLRDMSEHSIRQHTSAYVSKAYVSIRAHDGFVCVLRHMPEV
jgi:hypothetical protein